MQLNGRLSEFHRCIFKPAGRRDRAGPRTSTGSYLWAHTVFRAASAGKKAQAMQDLVTGIGVAASSSADVEVLG